MIYIREKLPYVALQDPTSAGIILAHDIRECAKTIKCLVRTLVHAARIRINNELSVEKRIQYAIQGMMHESIAYRCLVNVAPLRIGNNEMMIAAMDICPVL